MQRRRVVRKWFYKFDLLGVLYPRKAPLQFSHSVAINRIIFLANKIKIEDGWWKWICISVRVVPTAVESTRVFCPAVDVDVARREVIDPWNLNLVIQTNDSIQSLSEESKNTCGVGGGGVGRRARRALYYYVWTLSCLCLPLVFHSPCWCLTLDELSTACAHLEGEKKHLMVDPTDCYSCSYFTTSVPS